MHNLKNAIGVFGGTFDPIHFGHLRAALEIYQAFQLSEVRFVPSFQPVHRKPPVANAHDRLAMVTLAVNEEPAFKVDHSEIERQGASYTIDTLEKLRKEYPSKPLALIMGKDALLGFTNWHRYEDILEIAYLIVAHRPEYQIPNEGIIADLLKKRQNTIILHPVTAFEISATYIRKQIMEGKNPRYLLPISVLKYIQQHGVYGSSQL